MSVAQQREDGLGGIDLSLPVRAINRSDAPVEWMYDRIKHVLMPEVPTFVPYMCMVHWQGDPRAIDLPTGRAHEQYRRHQREHLRVLYGVYENDERWDEIPLVECYPIDSDVPFATVLADPEGNSLSGVSQTNNELAFLRAETERQAAALRQMQATLAAREGNEAAAAMAGMDPSDLDRQATESKAISPEEANVSMVGASPTRKSPVAKKRPAPGEGPQVTRDGE